MQAIEVRVWDPLIRRVHWLLAAAVLIDWFTDLPRGETRLGAAGKITSAADIRRLMDAGAAVRLDLSPSGDLDEAAARLFACLRALDDDGAARIAVAPIPERGLGAAINDRLRRAAAPREDDV